jgi:Fe-Mn family superoxide dismutase
MLWRADAARKELGMTYTLPPLPYHEDALDAAIDAETMRLHHDKHHAAYVNNLNIALEGHPALAMLTPEQLVASLSDVPAEIRTAVRNNAGGHVNHTFFWQSMTPLAGAEPEAELADALVRSFGAYKECVRQFSLAATALFGSGWTWLVIQPDASLAIESTANQDTPLMAGRRPILGLDVWEHAYYLRYQNRRAEYVAAWWQVVDWGTVADRYRVWLNE